MTHRDHLDDFLADYLGNELDDAGRAAARRTIAADPALAADVRSLERALADLRRLDPATDISTGGTAPDAASPPARLDPRRAGGRVFLRQAAVILLAFVAGFALRAAMPAEREATPPTEPIAAPGLAIAADSDWTIRAATSYLRHQDKSSLTRSLIALAQTDSARGQATSE